MTQTPIDVQMPSAAQFVNPSLIAPVSNRKQRRRQKRWFALSAVGMP